MNDIINKILDWPVIIQGILGSFLFWVVFTLGEKLFAYLSKKLKTEQKLGSDFGQLARKEIFEDSPNYNISFFSFFVCIYGALHYFLKFVLAIFMAFLISNFIPIFAYVGYIFGFYFLFRALSYVTHFSTLEKLERKEKSKTV